MHFLLARLFPQPLPDLHAVPDQTGAGLTIDWWVAAMGENKEVPGVGDVIIQISSCSMGMTCSRDTRHRVSGPAVRNGCSDAVAVVTENGDVDSLSVFYMRRHKTLPRTWFLMD